MTYSSLSTLPLFGINEGWIGGITPPLAIVVFAISLLSSSSFLTASWICLGIILVFLFSFAAFPANSRTSAARYSNTAER